MLRALLVVVVAAGLGFYILVNHSVARTVYACTGDLSVNGNANPETAFIAFDRYRWWIVWGASDGTAHFELSTGLQRYFSGLTEVSTGWHIYGDRNARGIPDGIFSTLSETLRLAVADGTVFEGQCARR